MKTNLIKIFSKLVSYEEELKTEQAQKSESEYLRICRNIFTFLNAQKLPRKELKNIFKVWNESEETSTYLNLLYRYGKNRHF